MSAIPQDVLSVLELSPLEAQIRFGQICEPPHALAVALQILREPSWRASRDAHRLIARLCRQGPGYGEKLLSEIVEQLQTSSALQPYDFEFMVQLVPTLRSCASLTAFLDRWIAIFVDRAKPGEAKFAVTLLRMLLTPVGHGTAELPAMADPVAQWLVDIGSAELARCGPELAWTVSAIAERQHDLLAPAFRILSRSAAAMDAMRFDGGGPERFWPVCEQALAAGVPREAVREFFLHVLPSLGQYGSERLLAPLDPARGMIQLAREMCTAVAASAPPHAAAFWSYAMTFPAGHVDGWSADSLRAAVACLVSPARSPRSTEHRSGWAYELTRAHFQVFGVGKPTSEQLGPAWPLDQLAAEPDLAAGVHQATREAVSRCAHHHRLASSWLAFAETNPRLTSVALLALSTERRDRSTWRHGVSPGELTTLLSMVVRGEACDDTLRPRHTALFKNVIAVEIAPQALEQDVLIDTDPRGVMHTADEHVYGSLCDKAPDRESALTLCSLYFVHEVIHVAQGIQHKERVEQLRRNGSEHALMHFDLEADDLAARIVASALARPLSEVKSVNTLGVRAFPASSFHTSASVYRKSLRLASLLVDELVHRELPGLMPPGESSGYASVELPPLRGMMLITWNGALRRLVAGRTLDPTEVDLLAACSRDVNSHVAVRDLLRSALLDSELVAPPSHTPLWQKNPAEL